MYVLLQRGFDPPRPFQLFWTRLLLEERSSDADISLKFPIEGLIIIDHTEVPETLSGLGLGVRLVESGVQFARDSGRKIVPLCPYAAHQFRKHAEWHDVLNR